MIPKILHYCWFGKSQKPSMFLKCFDSWKKYCPDYKIIEWNETNSEIFSNSFYKNALRKKKYAFVSDYVRSKVLYEYGGIYIDTDMLLLKPIDNLLQYNFFSGFEVDNRVAYGLFGGVKKNHFFNKMLHFYNENNFDEFSPPVITHTFKEVILNSNLNEKEILFDSSYFYPLTYQDKDKDYKKFINENTYAVHLWNHSWASNKKENIPVLLEKIKIVILDYLFFNYSKKYFRRYFKEFSRKIYLILVKR